MELGSEPKVDNRLSFLILWLWSCVIAAIVTPIGVGLFVFGHFGSEAAQDSCDALLEWKWSVAPIGFSDINLIFKKEV